MSAAHIRLVHGHPPRPHHLSGVEVAALTADRVAAYRARRQEEGLRDAPGRTHDAPPAEVSPASPSLWRRATYAVDLLLAALALAGVVSLARGGLAWGLVTAAAACAVLLAGLILDQIEVRDAGEGRLVPGRWIRRAR